VSGPFCGWPAGLLNRAKGVSIEHKTDAKGLQHDKVRGHGLAGGLAATAMKNRLSLLLSGVACTLLLAATALLRDDPRQLALMRNTLLLAAGAAAISLPAGTLLACLLLRTDTPGRRTGLFILLAMLFVPLYVQAASWDAGFGQLGWYAVSRGSMTEPLLDGWRAAIWVHAMAAIPWVTLITGVSVSLVEPELEEDALLSADTWCVLLLVTIPRAWGGIVVAAFWVLLTVVVEMTVTDLYRVRTYAEELYTSFALADPSALSAAVVPGGMAAAALVLLAVAIMLSAAPALRAPTRAARPLVLRRGRSWSGLVNCLLLLIIAGVPVGNLIYKAGMELDYVMGQRLLRWSLPEFVRIAGLSPWRFRDELGWTLLIGGLASAAALALGAPLAWWARRGGWRAAPAVAAVAGGAVLPGPLVGLGIIGILDRPTPALCVWLYDRTVFAPVLALTIRILPLVILMCWFAFRSIADDLLDHAACEGAGRWTQFWLIALPLRWTALAAAGLAGFAIATGDLACSILVIPPGVTTVSIRVFGLIHAGVDDQVAGLCLTIVAGAAIMTAATAALLRSNSTFFRSDGCVDESRSG
jgi:iron(III) transport system permease protein